MSAHEPIVLPTPAGGPDPYGNRDPEWLRTDWSKLRRTVDLPSPANAAGPSGAETVVNYVELGPPPGERDPLTLLFVHGLSGSWQNWLENLPHFAHHHRVLALDLPGFGDSPAPPWKVSIPTYGRLLHDFCVALELGDCAVIGSSMGGFIAAEAAIAEPGRFERLVLVSAAGVSSTRLRRTRTGVIARMLAAATPLTLKLQRGSFSRRRARARAFAGVFHHPEQLRTELVYEIFTGGARGSRFVEALTSLVGYDILDRLEEVDVPTLIVWGVADRIVPVRDALEFERRLARSRLELFDECGHMPMAERPERFNRVLAEFLRE